MSDNGDGRGSSGVSAVTGRLFKIVDDSTETDSDELWVSKGLAEKAAVAASNPEPVESGF